MAAKNKDSSGSETPTVDVTVSPSSSQTGKVYKGQKHFSVKTTEDVVAETKLQKQYNKPGTVKLSVWFSVRGVRNYTQQQAMRAFTKVKKATLEDWDAIFQKF